jgi:hypothetical protein
MRKTLIASVTVMGALALTGNAVAATKPTVATGTAANVTQTSATLRGTVNPQGSATTYYFQYGKAASYGAQTGPASAGAGTKGIAEKAPVVGLTPNTTYHFRVVATNIAGATVGADRTFTTPKQPLGFTLSATPNPVPLGGPTTISGQLTGTGNAGKGVRLQQRAFPYTGAFANVGNSQTVNAQGQFSFPILSLTQNTQYRVVTTGSGSVTSPVVLVGSQVAIHVAVSAHTIKSGQLVRFAGSVAPKEDGALYAVQKQKGATWVTVAGSSLRSYTVDKSRFARRIRIRHSGTYRIYVGVADGTHVSNASGNVEIKIKKIKKTK